MSAPLPLASLPTAAPHRGSARPARLPNLPTFRAAALVLGLGLLALAPRPVAASSGWVPSPGDGYVQLGFSRKTSDISWDAFGEDRMSPARFENHDFRYYYVAGDVGILHRLSATFLITYLDGLEGPDGDLHRNTGFSDAWLGLRYALVEGTWPIAASVTVRTAAFYDIDGPYTLDLHNEAGDFVANSPEWRGLLKEDWTAALSASRSFAAGTQWMNLSAGYTIRTGAPADQFPFSGEFGWHVPSLPFQAWARGRVFGALSLGNDSDKEPDDRFGSRPDYNFNDASMVAASIGLGIPIPSASATFEIGYNQWVWGRSARKYKEPYLGWTWNL